jgi:fatty acid desaturase
VQVLVDDDEQEKRGDHERHHRNACQEGRDYGLAPTSMRRIVKKSPTRVFNGRVLTPFLKWLPALLENLKTPASKGPHEAVLGCAKQPRDVLFWCACQF